MDPIPLTGHRHHILGIPSHTQDDNLA